MKYYLPNEYFGNRILCAGIELVLRRLQRDPKTTALTVLTTYDGLRKHHAALGLVEWTAVCLDEGQKIRNHDTEVRSIFSEPAGGCRC